MQDVYTSVELKYQSINKARVSRENTGFVDDLKSKPFDCFGFANFGGV